MLPAEIEQLIDYAELQESCALSLFQVGRGS
jgi:hypothetical protein